jgi:hypothetical protein
MWVGTGRTGYMVSLWGQVWVMRVLCPRMGWQRQWLEWEIALCGGADEGMRAYNSAISFRAASTNGSVQFNSLRTHSTSRYRASCSINPIHNRFASSVLPSA